MVLEEKKRANRFQVRQMLTPAVLLVLLVGVGIHLFGFLGVEIVWQALEEPDLPEPFIRLQPEEINDVSRMEAEYAQLFDSAPLFIPTRWNYLSRTEFSGYRLPETPPLFAPFSARSPQQPYSPERFRSLLRNSPKEYSRTLAFSPAAFFEGFGERVLVERPLGKRSAAVQVVSLQESRVVSERELFGDTLDALPESGWRPVEYLILVDSIGLVGRPYSLGSSGNEAVDAALLRWLGGGDLGIRLGPGYYRVKIGP